VIEYPSGWDVEWVAVDRRGYVAVFTTGAAGPVPRAYLEAGDLLERVSDAVSAMPEYTRGVVVAPVPSPESFESFARRGFFSFDWADVHRTRDKSGLYELQARPQSPMRFDEAAWPAEVRQVLNRLASASLDFEQLIVDVRGLDCEFDPREAAV
jgi:hypothetical protein